MSNTQFAAESTTDVLIEDFNIHYADYILRFLRDLVRGFLYRMFSAISFLLLYLD